MAKFKKLAMLTMALLASATLAAAVGCDGEESSSSSPSPAPAPGPAPITYETAKGILPNVVSVAANETVYYKYTATVDGSVSTTAYGDVDVSVNGGKSALVNKGDEVVIEVSGKNGKAVENATWYVKEGDGSSMDNSVILTEACEFDATITWNETDGCYDKFYAVFVPAEYNMYMVMLEQVGDDEIEGLKINSNPAEYAFGVWKDVYPGSEERLTLSIATPDEIPEGTTPADVTVSLKGYVAPLKTPEIQPTIVEVEDSTAIYAEYYYEIDEYTIFKYTPAKDGVVTFTAPYGGEITALLDLDSVLANKEPEFMLNGEGYLEFPATAGVPVYFRTDEGYGPLVVMYEDREYVEPVVVPAGTSDDPMIAVAGENTTTFTADETGWINAVYYTYTAEKDSTVKFTSTSETLAVAQLTVHPMLGREVEMPLAFDTEVIVAAGETLKVAMYFNGEIADGEESAEETWNFVVAEGVEPNGTAAFPYAITAGTAVTVEQDQMTNTWPIYAYTATADGTVTFSNITEGGEICNINNGTYYDATSSVKVKAGTVLYLEARAFDSSWNSIACNYTLVFTAGTVIDDGSEDLPFAIAENNKTTFAEPAEGEEAITIFYYTYTATADGTITFMCDEESVPEVVNTNGYHSLTLNVSYNVKAGETITFLVQCPKEYDSATEGYVYFYGEYDWSLVFTANATGEDFGGNGMIK